MNATQAPNETTPPAEPANATLQPSSAQAWKRGKTHRGLTLPSGAVVDVVLPNLGSLIKRGELPNELLEAAIGHQKAETITRDMIVESWDYVRWIVPRAVVAPEITEDDVEDLDVVDVEMIASWASRTNDIDAVGHHLGGLETNADWRRFRGFLTLDEVAASV